MKLSVIFTFLFTLLVGRFFFYLAQPALLHPGEDTSFCGRLQDEPKLQFGKVSFHIDGISVQTLSENLHYGQYVCVAGIVQELKGKTSNRNFSLPMLEKVNMTIYSPNVNLKNDPLSTALSGIFTLRNRLLSSIYIVLPKDEAALFIGIFLGDKQGFSKELLTIFQNTGTMHIVAASGMNITLLSGMLLALLLPLLHRRVALSIAILVLLFYAVVALLSPSIVRAAIMGVGVLLAGIFGRQAHPGFLLTIAVIIMLFITPSLVFDVGFLLSVAATAGLVFVKPLLDEVSTQWKTLSSIPFIGEDFSTTLVSFASTAPILLSSFGTLSLIGLISNIFILWTVPILMSLGILYCCVFFIPAISSLLLYLAYPLLVFDLGVLKFLNLPFFSLKAERFTLLFTIAYYCIFLSLFFFLKTYQFKKEEKGNQE